MINATPNLIRVDKAEMLLLIGGIAFMVILLYAMEDCYNVGYQKGYDNAVIQSIEQHEYPKDSK